MVRPSWLIISLKNIRFGREVLEVGRLYLFGGPFLCIVSTAACTTKRNRTGARLSPCFTPEIELKVYACTMNIYVV
jgi:hypothetical protein